MKFVVWVLVVVGIELLVSESGVAQFRYDPTQDSSLHRRDSLGLWGRDTLLQPFRRIESPYAFTIEFASAEVGYAAGFWGTDGHRFLKGTISTGYPTSIFLAPFVSTLSACIAGYIESGYHPNGTEVWSTLALGYVLGIAGGFGSYFALQNLHGPLSEPLTYVAMSGVSSLISVLLFRGFNNPNHPTFLKDIHTLPEAIADTRITYPDTVRLVIVKTDSARYDTSRSIALGALQNSPHQDVTVLEHTKRWSRDSLHVGLDMLLGVSSFGGMGSQFALTGSEYSWGIRFRFMSHVTHLNGAFTDPGVNEVGLLCVREIDAGWPTIELSVGAGMAYINLQSALGSPIGPSPQPALLYGVTLLHKLETFQIQNYGPARDANIALGLFAAGNVNATQSAWSAGVMFRWYFL
jgi:hypothetical protein